MKGAWLLRSGAALALATGAAAGFGQGTEAAYTVDVWASVLFGADGRATEYALQDEARYPARFAENVKARVARARIDPPLRDGKPVTLRTGVRMDFEVTPRAEGASVRMLGLVMSPLPAQRRHPAFPKEPAGAPGWQGEVSGSCTVSVEGLCTQISVAALPGLPENVRRYMRDTLAGWRFEPQQIDGQRVEAPFSLSLALDTRNDEPDDFRQDKFDRVLKGR